MKRLQQLCLFLVLSNACTNPPIKSLKDPMKLNSSKCNSEIKNLSLKSSQDLRDSKSFVKAASGLILKDKSFYIVQDTSRYLAKLHADLNGSIEMIALADLKMIAELEDPKKPYLEFRKERKADFEAMTLLHDGRILILGSGYDAQKIDTGKKHYKNIGIIYNTTNHLIETLNLEKFYQKLLQDTNVVGYEKDGLKPRLNIEGVSVIGNEIVFLHRSNYNKNSHDSLIFYQLNSWLAETHKSEWKLQPAKIVLLDFGFAKSKEGLEFPINGNDLIFTNGYFYLPIASESDTVVDGKDIDGDVIFTGLAELKLNETQITSCQIYRFTDPKMAKIEGLAADPNKIGSFFAVHDVDSEEVPSKISSFNL